jgi:lipopolysaccharide/colanic/teichoic acid biosynthesis glycosyltransferase
MALLCATPLMALIALAIWLREGRPVLFRQRRIGLQDREFTLWKFRSMALGRDLDGRSLPDSVRLTALGKILRGCSLDELPQLWNVLTGDMSLVGPRPLLPEYLPRYNEFQRRRHAVKPGITGWAQVNGRNGLTWERKFELDVWYVDHWSLWLDATILWMTLLRVGKRDGISQGGHATMPKFKGTTHAADQYE